MKWVPFTLHMKIDPAKPGKRYEMWRDMQKISTYVYEALESLVPSYLNIAYPGGGQHLSNGGFSGYASGTAVKPQFGETPAQIQITGFYNSSQMNIQPNPDMMILTAGEQRTGSKQHVYDSNPSNIIDNEVLALKTIIEATIGGFMPAGVNATIFRLEYSGIIYGDRGRHIPS